MLKFTHPLPESEILAGRQGLLLATCAGGTVLHVGCVDSGLSRERFTAGELLHQRLAKVASELWGTDVDVEGVRFLQEQGVGRLFAIDLTSQAPPNELAAVEFDVIILGEVLEHLPHPAKMLAVLRDLMTPGRTRLIVSVPNAFSLTALFSLARGMETVHPDHNYYFSSTTLRTLLTKAGLTILKEYVYVFDPEYLPAARLKGALFFDLSGRTARRTVHSSIRRLLGRLRHLTPAAYPAELGRTLLSVVLYRRTPHWGDGIVAICSRDDDSALGATRPGTDGK